MRRVQKRDLTQFFDCDYELFRNFAMFYAYERGAKTRTTVDLKGWDRKLMERDLRTDRHSAWLLVPSHKPSVGAASLLDVLCRLLRLSQCLRLVNTFGAHMLCFEMCLHTVPSEQREIIYIRS